MRSTGITIITMMAVAVIIKIMVITLLVVAMGTMIFEMTAVGPWIQIYF